VFNRFHRFRAWFTLMGFILWLGPGVAFLWCAQWMRWHGSSTAAVIALCATVLQALGAAALLYFAATFEPVTVLPIGLCVMWLIALADCVRHLVRARRFLQSAVERVRGFDAVVKPKQVLPVNEKF
jgi:hypothetical protein